ncbi:MAG: hypothetical protein LBC30_04575 [Puniceicoccales bacterium]|jgi:hypothetical protein|nr:hypothetical protein [Puniceicoccales bacterium]
MPKLRKTDNRNVVPPPPPPPPLAEVAEGSGPADLQAHAASAAALGYQVELPDQAPAPFIIRLTGIADTELQRREALIAEMGSAPEETREARSDKFFNFMHKLWNEAEGIFNASRESVIQKMDQQGKEFSEIDGRGMVFMNLLMRSILDSKCVSCQMPTRNGSEKRFFPIEVVEKPTEYVGIARRLAMTVSELPPLEDTGLPHAIREEILRDLDEDFIQEREQILRIFGVDDWCDARLVLKANVLRNAVSVCGKSYIEYRRATQIQGGAELFGQGAHAESQLQSGADVATFVNSMDFSF